MVDTAKQKVVTTDSFRVFGGSFSAHPLPRIPTKYNIKEAASKGNIRGPFYIPKGEGSGDG